MHPCKLMCHHCRLDRRKSDLLTTRFCPNLYTQIDAKSEPGPCRRLFQSPFLTSAQRSHKEGFSISEKSREMTQPFWARLKRNLQLQHLLQGLDDPRHGRPRVGRLTPALRHQLVPRGLAPRPRGVDRRPLLLLDGGCKNGVQNSEQ